MQTAQKQTVSQFELSNLIRKCKLFSKIKLKPASRLVLESLVFHYPNIRVRIETLQDETGCSERSINGALDELSRTGMILVTRTGRSSIYNLTQRFFDLLEIAPQIRKKEPIRTAEIALPQNIHEKRKPKREFPKFKQPDGPTYKKYIPEPKVKESPLDLNRKQAEEFLRNLPQRMQNTYFAQEVRKKWAIKSPPVVQRQACS